MRFTILQGNNIDTKSSQMLVFDERGKTSKNREDNQQSQSTYDAESGNWTSATLVDGKYSHHKANPAPNMADFSEVDILLRVKNKVLIFMKEGRHSIKTCPTGFNWMAVATWVTMTVTFQFRTQETQKLPLMTGTLAHVFNDIFVFVFCDAETNFLYKPTSSSVYKVDEFIYHLRVGFY